MIPATLVLIGPRAEADQRVAQAARWLPYEIASDAVLGASGATDYRTSAGAAARDAGDELRVVQWPATGAAAPRRPPTFAQQTSPSNIVPAAPRAPRTWLACSGSWLPSGDTDARLPAATCAAQPLTQTGHPHSVVALLDLAARDALWPLPADLHGQGTALWQVAGGEVCATCDGHGGGLLYYGRTSAVGPGAVIAIGNRASLVAAALSTDGAPTPLPGELIWPLSRMGSPLGCETPYAGVSLLPQGGRLRVRRGGLLVDGTPDVVGQLHDFDALAEDLVRRPLALDAYPDHPVEVMISGGKDIRLVLAALRAADRLSRVSRAVIWAPQGDPDLAVGRQLAAHLGIPIEVRAAPLQVGGWQAGFERHAFLTEGMVHAWDRKGAASVPDVITLNGYFGEFYKSHVRRTFALGKPAWRHFYGRSAWFDRHKLLTPVAEAHLRGRFQSWLSAREAEVHPWDLLNDRWHREARMQRWVGHILQGEACATPWLQLLPSARLLERYVAGPLSDRVRHRLHFELLRRLGPDLLDLPLADDRWARQLDRTWTAPAARRRVGRAPSAQAALWATHGAEMAAWLRAGLDDGMAEWVAPRALEALLRRALAAAPSDHDLVGLMALLGVRAAFARPQPRPTRVVPA